MIHLACHEDIRDIGDVSSPLSDAVEAFANSFRSNRFLGYCPAVDDYVTAGAFILLTRRTTISPCDYYLWILQATLISWLVLEDSYDLTYFLEDIFGPPRSNEIHKSVFTLTTCLNWNTHMTLDELEEALKQLKVEAPDILKPRDHTCKYNT